MDARTLISEIVKRDVAVSADTSLGEVDGWDSLKGVRLVLRLETIVGRQLAETEIEALQSVGDVEVLLNQKS